jgi:hypothetical protein
VAVIDTLGEYSEIFPPLPGQLTLAEQVYLFAKWRPESSVQASFLLPPEHMSTAFNYLCKAAYMAGNLTLVIEEIDYFSKPTWNEPGLDLLIRYGRHRNVNVIYTVRNLVETSRRLTSQTDAFVIFRIDEPRYLDEIEKRLGVDVAVRVANLGEHEHTIVEINPSQGQGQGQSNDETV